MMGYKVNRWKIRAQIERERERDSVKGARETVRKRGSVKGARERAEAIKTG